MAFVHAVSTATKFHVAVPGDRDPKGGIWIYISMDRGFRAETFLAAHARLAGRSMRLTRAEAAQVARYIARAIGRREAPWHSGVLRDEPNIRHAHKSGAVANTTAPPISAIRRISFVVRVMTRLRAEQAVVPGDARMKGVSLRSVAEQRGTPGAPRTPNTTTPQAGFILRALQDGLADERLAREGITSDCSHGRPRSRRE